MPYILEPMPDTHEPAPNRIRWTRSQCEAIRNADILTDHYELIDGEIISKMGQKPAHAYVVGLLLSWLVHVFGSEYTRIQSTIDVSQASPLYDEPEPDAAVTAEPNTAYADHHPEPEDLLLVIEVSDSTVRFDRSTKAALYARAGIADYWVVDLPGRRIVVHRQPSGNGYGEITAYTAEERVAPLVRPADTILVADLLPPAVE